MRIRAIAFDLDGTLVDTAGGIAHALNSALADAGLPVFDLATVRAWIGDGPDVLIARALAAGPSDPLEAPALAQRLRAGFDDATLRAPMQGSSVFDDIPRVVAVLAARFPLAVVTNKPTPLARAVVEAAGLIGFFGAVHGADTPQQRKPSPLLIEEAAARLDMDVDALLMVGDSDADIGAARAAGSAIAWAGWGYGRPPPRSRAIWHLGAPGELVARLETPGRLTTEHR